MSRWIDAEALIDTLGVSDEEIDFKEILRDAPSIDIVRCKECRHRVVEEQSWSEYNEYCDLWCDGNGYWASVNADDFCSYGERSE